MSNKTVIQQKALVNEMIQQIYEIKKENLDLKNANRRLESDKDLLIRYEKSYKDKTKLLELQEDRILELRQEKNRLRRELNRREFNYVKSMAIILATIDYNGYQNYKTLDLKTQKAYREYVALFE